MDSHKTRQTPKRFPEAFEELLEAPRGKPLAMLHSGDRGPARLFTEPVGELTIAPEDWEGAWARLEDFLARQAGQVCVGWLGYDLRDDVETLPRSISDDFPVPVLHFVAYQKSQEWEACAPPEGLFAEPADELRAHTSQSDYQERVARIVEHIHAGDLFQANLTQPFTGRHRGDPRALFASLCAASPAPMAAYLETSDGVSVLSSSPEEFLWLDDRAVRTRPIKGTRPRGVTREEDERLLKELRASEKDCAELAMIVDLLRNDLGKVAETGTVQVGPFPEHDSFAQVHHLLATVTATLREDRSMVDLLRATFPGGSITGAPKLRAMEIIEDLEMVRRGVYTGAIGWIGPGSRMHLSIAIRTMVWKDGIIRFNTGGGITAESDPAEEFAETLHKAAGLAAALRAEIQIP